MTSRATKRTLNQGRPALKILNQLFHLAIKLSIISFIPKHCFHDMILIDHQRNVNQLFQGKGGGSCRDGVAARLEPVRRGRIPGG